MGMGGGRSQSPGLAPSLACILSPCSHLSDCPPPPRDKNYKHQEIPR